MNRDEPQAKTRVLALAGSLREASFNRKLLAAAAECAPATLQVIVYRDLASVPLFDEDLERAGDGGPEGVRRLRREIDSADGLLIATPEYNQSIPGVLKNAVDWLSRPGPQEVLAGKPVAVIGATVGRWGTRLAQAALRHILHANQALILPQPLMFVREAEQLFDADGKLADQPTRNDLRELLGAFAQWIESVRP